MKLFSLSLAAALLAGVELKAADWTIDSADDWTKNVASATEEPDARMRCSTAPPGNAGVARSSYASMLDTDGAACPEARASRTIDANG